MISSSSIPQQAASSLSLSLLAIGGAAITGTTAILVASARRRDLARRDVVEPVDAEDPELPVDVAFLRLARSTASTLGPS